MLKNNLKELKKQFKNARWVNTRVNVLSYNSKSPFYLIVERAFANEGIKVCLVALKTLTNEGMRAFGLRLANKDYCRQLEKNRTNV